VLEAEIKDIQGLGVEIKTNAKLESLGQIKNLGYDAVCLAMGAQLSRRMSLPGLDQNKVLWGLDFLKAIRRGENPQVGAKVVVVGGGNVAIDAAMSALRQGAQEVRVVCLEKCGEMPAHEKEMRAAEAEGVKVLNSWGPVAIAPDGKISLRRCERVFDDKGVFNPAYDDNDNMELEADQVILAIGQAADLALAQGSKIALAGGLLAVDEKTLQTGEPGVFAGGDAVAMPGAVIQAVAAGRKAAGSIDQYLGGDGDVSLELTAHEPPSPRLGRIEGFAGLPRIKAAERGPNQGKADYKELCLGFSAQEAEAEAGRCLRCDLRLTLNAPPGPPRQVLPLNQDNLGQAPESEGVLVLFDGGHNILAIQGAENLREALRDRLEGGSAAAYFEFAEDPMFSKAEAERIQAYMQQHGSMPPGDGSAGDDDLDDLF
jgi:thioredoxin reductase